MALTDTGLIARYYIDEAASGTAPTQVDDVSGNGYHLTDIDYGAGNMAYTEVSGNRGLESTSTTGDQIARRAINDTSDALRDALAGSQTATIEVVVAIDSISASTGRIFAINNRSGSNATLGLTGTSLSSIRGQWEGLDGRAVALSGGQRYVLHVVYDTTQATSSDRILIYVDGTSSGGGTAWPAQNDTLTLPSSIDLTAFNRESSGNFDRSFDGILYYAAIYSHAFSAAEVDGAYDVLTLDDDEPAAGGGGGALHASSLSLLGVGR